MHKKFTKYIVYIVILLFIALSALAATGYIVIQSKQQPAESPPLYRNGSIDRDYSNYAEALKPVIYLYPQHTQRTRVQLELDGTVQADYPAMQSAIHGWDVTAYPDGRLVNSVDQQEYSYLFWEGSWRKEPNWNFTKGFLVPGNETREFLQKTLAGMGLTPREYNEFIVFWYPRMKDNPYNMIHFAGSEYTDVAKLHITPQPDSVLRVYMVFKPLQTPPTTEPEPQTFPPFTRDGFTVVEWGGEEL